MKKITKKEVNAKKDYVVVNLYHERYSADLNISIHKNQSIADIYDDYRFGEPFDINKLKRQGFEGMGYVYDNCGYYEPNDYELTKKECKRFKGYHIEVLTIIELSKFLEEGYFGTLVMNTNKKWGLLDYSYKPIDMHLNKSIIYKIDNYLYCKYEWYRKFKEFTWKIKRIPYRIKYRIKKCLESKGDEK